MTAPKIKTNSASTTPTRSHRPLVSPDAGDALPASMGMHAVAATTTILRANNPAPRGKSKKLGSERSGAESPSPLGPYDRRAMASEDSYVLLKPTRSKKDTKSGAASESPSIPSSALSSSAFPIPEDSEGNPLYIPDSRLDRVRRIDDLQHRRGASTDLFGAIDLTFDGAQHGDNSISAKNTG
jgi:hypothetical protein